MKKLIPLLIALAVMACAGLALAEGIDLAGLTDEEIVALKDRVQEEIVARHIEGTATLSRGTYVAGRDFPAGSYVYTCLATGNEWGNVTIYTEKGEGKQLLWKVLSAPDDGEEPESFFISLNEDDQLRSDVPFSLTIYGGVTFQ